MRQEYWTHVKEGETWVVERDSSGRARWQCGPIVSHEYMTVGDDGLARLDTSCLGDFETDDDFCLGDESDWRIETA